MSSQIADLCIQLQNNAEADAAGDRGAIGALRAPLAEPQSLAGLDPEDRELVLLCAAEGLAAAGDHLGRPEFAALVQALGSERARAVAIEALERGVQSNKTAAIMCLRQAAQWKSEVADQAAILLAAVRGKLSREDYRAIARRGLRVPGEHHASALFARGLERDDEQAVDALRNLLRERPREPDPGHAAAQLAAVFLLAEQPHCLEPGDLTHLRTAAEQGTAVQRNRIFDAIGEAMNAEQPLADAAKVFTEIVRETLAAENLPGAAGLRAVVRKHVLRLFASEQGDRKARASLAPWGVRWADDETVAERAIEAIGPSARSGDPEALAALSEAVAATARHVPLALNLLASELLVSAASRGRAQAVCHALLAQIQRSVKKDDRTTYLTLGRAAAKLAAGDGLAADALGVVLQGLKQIPPSRPHGIESVFCGLLALATKLDPAARQLLVETFSNEGQGDALPGTIFVPQTRLKLRKALLAIYS